ncbi:ABC transporter permease [Spelaeicoccus albus]|uniref:ABC-2 type transport system permease protein n=1 Tax=Spelaeicoccus albus TaxID=1280376 RepID=A0A7Z0D550_9MICO|nr:ABC transporter permease subunit [Spelaeicoccus albus]NYI69040.1 ABC-2 type transport system permease protein [Spelaeicoccus albus]
MSPDDPFTTGDARPAAARHGGRALVASEIGFVFRRRRTWAMLAALALIPVLIGVVVRVTSSGPPAGRGPQFLSQITDNGLFVGLTALVVSIPLFLPLTVGVVAGDTIAGEAGAGTLRYLLVAPAGRVRLLGVKYIGAAVFCLSAVLAVVVAGTVIGLILFPVGPVPLLSGETISVAQSLGRLLLVAAFVCVSLLGMTAIGLFISTLTDVPVGAMAATIVLAVVSQVLDSLPQLSWLHPWLFSHYWLEFAGLLRSPISWDAFGANSLLQLGYIAMFGALAYARFTTKDVLS